MERTSRPARRHGGRLSKFGERMRTLAGFWTKKKSAGVFLTFTRGSGEEHGDREEAEAEIDVGGAPAALCSELRCQLPISSGAMARERAERCANAAGLGAPFIG